MNKHPWIKNITEEDMPNEDMKIIAGLCGVDVAMSLIDKAPGLLIRIPNNSFKHLKDEYILKNHDGTRGSVLKLAVECEVSDSYIYSVFKKQRTSL